MNIVNVIGGKTAATMRAYACLVMVLGLLLTGCAATTSARVATTKVPLPPRQTTQPGCPVPGTVIDDRASATAFVRSYYNALDRHDFPRAYGYFTPLTGASPTPAPPTFADWKGGYATTACAIITYVGAEMAVTDATAGYAGIHTGTVVPVTLTAVHLDGTLQQFTGAYAISYDPAAGIAKSGAIALNFSTLTPQ